MNHIQFKNLGLKNFMSFGSRPTVINLQGEHITVVLGLNHDTGGDESRNGVGKSAMIDALSYVLYGKTNRGISNAKLVNKLMRKGQGMLVTLELDTPEGAFLIERGEQPGRLRLFRKELDDPADFLTRDAKTFVYEVSRASKAETTKEIERIIGFDIRLFEFLIANTSETEPFMKLPEDKKREVAERLMGLNRLTERAEELKEDRKDQKKQLIAAESALEATQRANERIEGQIAELVAKEEGWEEQHQSRLTELRDTIAQMEQIDAAEQIEILNLIDELTSEMDRVEAVRKQADSDLREAKRDLRDLQKEIDEGAARMKELGEQKAKLEASTCPTCNQHWVPDPSVIEEVDKEIDELGDYSVGVVPVQDAARTAVADVEQRIKEIDTEEAELNEAAGQVAKFNLVFESVEEASVAGAVLKATQEELVREERAENPHTESIQGLREQALQEIDDSDIRELRKMVRHLNYLIELLQARDSFLRKSVIDRWLPKLNGRIAHYLETLELPFQVRIENDLTMTITDFGEEFDWGNLSKGQRQRVTIAMNLAFQDLFEATNHGIGLLMVDELIDSGICNRGATQALAALQETCEKKQKRVFLITHRADIADQVDDVMLVEMKNRVSRIEEDDDGEFDE